MLPNIKTVLYATDLSGNSAHACGYAVYLAEKTGAQVHILHVAEKLPADALDTLETYIEDFDDRKHFLRARMDTAKRLLQERFDLFWQGLDEEEQKLRSLISSVQVVESAPAEAIIKHADKVKADLIVMGTHQKGPLEAFLGSISRRVLGHSTIPTLVVPIGKT